MKLRPLLKDLVSVFEIGTALYFGVPNNAFAQRTEQNRIYSHSSDFSVAGEGVALKDFVFDFYLNSDSRINLNDKFGLYAKKGDISYDIVDARKGLQSIISYLKKDLNRRDSQSKRKRIATINYYEELLKETSHNDRVSLSKLEKAVKDGTLDVKKEELNQIKPGRYFIIAESEGKGKNRVPIILNIKKGGKGLEKTSDSESPDKSRRTYWRFRRESGKDTIDISSESKYSEGEKDIEWEELEYEEEIDWGKDTSNVITESKTKKRNNWDAFYNTHFGLALGAVIDNYEKSVNPSGKPVGFKAARGGLELDAFLRGPNSEINLDLRFLNDNDGYGDGYINKTKEGELSFVYTPRVINFEGASISPAGGVGLESRVSSDEESISNELMKLRTDTKGEFRETIKWLGLGGKINARGFSMEALYKFLKGGTSLDINSQTFQGTDLIVDYKDLIETLADGSAFKISGEYNNGTVSVRASHEFGNKIYVPFTNNASIIDPRQNNEYSESEIELMLNLRKFLLKTGFTARENRHVPFEEKDRTGAKENAKMIYQIGIGAGIKF